MGDAYLEIINEGLKVSLTGQVSLRTLSQVLRALIILHQNTDHFKSRMHVMGGLHPQASTCAQTH